MLSLDRFTNIAAKEARLTTEILRYFSECSLNIGGCGPELVIELRCLSKSQHLPSIRQLRVIFLD
jgi:hypothetical protein